MNQVFVYGTLMAGERQGGLLANCRRVQAWCHGELWLLPQGYPALSLQGRSRVWGELVTDVSAGQLTLLDVYEGTEQGLYERVEIAVTVGLKTMGAWAYVQRDPRRVGGRRIPNGRWTAIRRR